MQRALGGREKRISREEHLAQAGDRAATAPRPRHRLLLVDRRRQEATSSLCVQIPKGLAVMETTGRKPAVPRQLVGVAAWVGEEMGMYRFFFLSFFFFTCSKIETLSENSRFLKQHL